MNARTNTEIDTHTLVTVQILGASLLREAVGRLLTTEETVNVANGEGPVLLLLGSEGQAYLRQSRQVGKRRRKEHFVLLTNARDIDYRLVREAPIEVFVGVDEPLSTLIQGIHAASRGEAFCSPQLVPALISAAVTSAAPFDRESMASPFQDAWSRQPADRLGKKPVPDPLKQPEDSQDFGADEAESMHAHAPEPAEMEENSLSQEVRTQRLAVALGLSEREAEVAIEAVKGFSNVEIAELLNISLPTIKYHLYRAYQKLGIRRRSQLAAALFVPTLGD